MLFPWRHRSSIYLEFKRPECVTVTAKRGAQEAGPVQSQPLPGPIDPSSLFLPFSFSLATDSEIDFVMRYGLNKILLHFQTFSGRERNLCSDQPFVAKSIANFQQRYSFMGRTVDITDTYGV